MTRPFPPPQVPFREVCRRAFEEIASVDPRILAGRSGGTLCGTALRLVLLGRAVEVDLEGRTVRREGGGPVPDFVAASVARYLALSERLSGETGGWVGFADDPGARGYWGPFRSRVLAPLLASFGRRPEAFAAAALALGGVRVPPLEAPGSLAFRLTVLPRAELVFALSPGDDELPAEGQVLFPRRLPGVFPVEDRVWLAGMASLALRGRHPAGSSC